MDLFLIIILVCFLLYFLLTFSIFAKGFGLRRNPSNENTRRFIRFAKRLYIMPNHPIIWGSLRKTYHRVSENENIDYNLRVELFEILKKRGVSGLYYPRTALNHMTLEEKLDELEVLKNKGKVNEEEYKQRRLALLNNK